jgi:hypothetical protein
MVETLLMLLKICVVFATAGSLLELGLQLERIQGSAECWLRESETGIARPIC